MIIKEIYTRDFYLSRHETTEYSATVILPILLDRIPSIQSAVDIGCGVGTWLSVLQSLGIKEIKGLDGSWVDKDLFVIPSNCFMGIDFNTTAIKLQNRYDLAISLEVAEHIKSDLAASFISSLTKLSDNVLFSAAIPYQGGKNHVNEQWQHYWVNLFNELEYEVHDFIRPAIWDDNRIPCHYRQNILFFQKRQALKNDSSKLIDHGIFAMPLDLVHPDLYISKINTRGVKGNFKLFLRSLKDFISRKVG